MEYNGHDFLEELLALRTDPWELATNIPNLHSVDNFLETPFSKIPPNFCCEEFSNFPFDPQTLNCSSFSEFCAPFGNEVVDSSNNKLDTPPLLNPCEEEYSLFSIVDDLEVQAANACKVMDELEVQAANACKIEPVQPAEVPIFNMGMCLERKTKANKLVGQPSKNLMAERRRRKRLNDRLSMLRSVVPKISKMDRTSILGDAIDYMKELLERINNLQEKIEVGSNNPHKLSFTSIFKDVRPNEFLVRNSPKFDVERRNIDTRIEICCAGKPGLLLSTVTTLEALGLEIQQCVISCFNDFGMQASCSELVETEEFLLELAMPCDVASKEAPTSIFDDCKDMEQRGNVSSEDIKQALFRNAGYGGRCL